MMQDFMHSNDIAEDQLVMDAFEVKETDVVEAPMDAVPELSDTVLGDAIDKDNEEKTSEEKKDEEEKDEAGPSGYTPTVKKVGKKSKTSKNNAPGNSVSAKEIKEIQQSLLEKQTEALEKIETKKQEFQGELFGKLFGMLERVINKDDERSKATSSEEEEPPAKKAKSTRGKVRGRGKK